MHMHQMDTLTKRAYSKKNAHSDGRSSKKYDDLQTQSVKYVQMKQDIQEVNNGAEMA